LFILYEKTLLVEDKMIAKQKYKQLLSELDFTPLEVRLIENEEKYIQYHNIEKKGKKYKISVYYRRRFRILYFKYIRRYGVE